MRSKHAFKPASLDRLESREVLSTINPALIPSGSGRNAFGGPTGFTGQFNGAGRTFADAGQVGGTTSLNQFGGPTGFTGRFNGSGNTFTDRRVGNNFGVNSGLTFNNGLGTNNSAFANNGFGASSGLIFNNGLGTGNVMNVNPFNRFAGQNGFSPANGLTTNNSNGFATGTVTGRNGRTFFIPGR